jgi:hypothetical protein
MGINTLDTAMAKQLVDTAAVQGASIIGQAGGWSVMLKLGSQEKSLTAQRSDKPRTWRSLDRCVEYLKNELHIARFDLLDATHHSSTAPGGSSSRKDSSERLRQAHAAAGHDKWFREQVALGLLEADSPDAEWVSNEEASASWARKRAELAKRVEGDADRDMNEFVNGDAV